MNNPPPGGQFPQGYPQGYPPQQQQQVFPAGFNPQHQAALNLQQQGLQWPGYPTQQSQQQGFNAAGTAASYGQNIMQQQQQAQLVQQALNLRNLTGSPAPPASMPQPSPPQHQPQQPTASAAGGADAQNSKKRRLEDVLTAATAAPPQPTPTSAPPAPAGAGVAAGGPSTSAAPGAAAPAAGLMPPPPVRKRTEDDAWVLPRRGVQLALKAAGLDKDFKLEPSMELHSTLMELYGSLIENAVQFGCANAQLRKSAVLKPRDMAVYLERNWNIHVPGFVGEQLRPHRRPAASDLHRKRLLASRQTQNEAAAAAEGAAEGAGKDVGK